MTVTQNEAANSPQKIIAELQRKLDERTAELDEALERETATADVLNVISRSFDLQSVLATLVETVARLCDAEMAFILRRDGEVYRAGAAVGFSREYMEFLQCHPISTDRGTVTGRVALEGRIVQIADVTADPEYTLTEAGTLTGQRTALGVPLFRGEEVIGVIVLARRRIGLFTERQIELVTTFADQAVIAIENARLFNETKEALDRQTATAEILRVISQSPTDARPVFERIVLTALPLLRCESVFVMLCDNTTFFTAAAVTPDGLVSDVGRTRLPIDPDVNFPSRAIIERKTLYLPDWSLLDLPEHEREVRERLHIDSSLYLPLLRGEACVGLLALVGKRANSFGPSEIAQAESFRDQALIAMENARLFTETKEALERQTATAEILKVIASSHSDVQPVLETIAESTMRLLNGWSVLVTLFDGEQLHFGAARGALPDTEQYLRGLYPVRVGSATGSHRAILERRPVNIPDALADPSPQQRESARTRGYRAALAVPMIHNGQSIGVIAASRKEPGAFADPEVAVLQTFADQAVIAIENVNLFNQLKAKTGDLEELLYQQTATAEVLKVISESVFELQPVFDTMAENAVRLCKAERALIFRFDGNLLRAVASHNVGPELWQFIDRNPIAPGRQSISARAALYRRTVQVADVQSDADYSYAPRDVDLIRTIVAVPMLKGDQLVGTITIYKLEAKPFTDKQITLIETFAEQAVIAIENARLFEEVQARTRDLSQSLDDLRTAQDRLVQAEKLASLGQLTAGIAHEIKNPLNFVNNFADLSGELLQELKEAAAPALTALDDEKRAEVDEIMGMLDRNLGKIAEHGRRADGIVKSMLAHSRGGSSERRAVDLNNLVEEALNLAYHGARAQDQSFNITLERAFDPDLAPIELVPQDVTRVLLNLIGNGFYAANKRSQEASNRPVLKVSTRDLGTAVEIRVRDNGIGIAPIYRDKLFQPFFTTKPTGEGTGLGLSISYDIVTQQHGGTIEVDSEPGAFTEFTVRLPRGRQIATGGARER